MAERINKTKGIELWLDLRRGFATVTASSTLWCTECDSQSDRLCFMTAGGENIAPRISLAASVSITRLGAIRNKTERSERTHLSLTGNVMWPLEYIIPFGYKLYATIVGFMFRTSVREYEVSQIEDKSP